MVDRNGNMSPKSELKDLWCKPFSSDVENHKAMMLGIGLSSVAFWIKRIKISCSQAPPNSNAFFNIYRAIAFVHSSVTPWKMKVENHWKRRMDKLIRFCSRITKVRCLWLVLRGECYESWLRMKNDLYSHRINFLWKPSNGVSRLRSFQFWKKTIEGGGRRQHS